MCDWISGPVSEAEEAAIEAAMAEAETAQYCADIAASLEAGQRFKRSDLADIVRSWPDGTPMPRSVRDAIANALTGQKETGLKSLAERRQQAARTDFLRADYQALRGQGLLQKQALAELAAQTGLSEERVSEIVHPRRRGAKKA